MERVTGIGGFFFRSADPDALLPLVEPFVFRTPDKDAVAAPACKAQGNYPGFSTSFPQLRAERDQYRKEMEQRRKERGLPPTPPFRPLRP